jgi:predicted nucleotidyltransferase
MMDNFEATKTFLSFARKVIENEFAKAGVNVSGMMLFGSRARGDAKSDSDWDFLVITSGQIPQAEKARIILAIQRIFAKKLISVDIMVKTQERIEAERNDAGFMVQTVLAEAISV